MGLSSLAVMGNSLTLQLQGRPKLPDMTGASVTHSSSARQSDMHTTDQRHHERQDSNAAARVNG